ncbi:MAG TPA: hypothetical protein VF175_02155 [Lacipirellula sp.]
MHLSYRRVLPLAVTSVCLLSASPTPGQTISAFQSNAGSLDWFNPLNWSAGDPNAPGDAALFTLSGGLKKAELTAPATLGRIEFSGAGAGEVAGGRTITFDQPGTAAAEIEVDGPHPLVTIRPVLSMASSEALRLSVGSGGHLTLTGGFSGGDGAVEKIGEGSTTLAGGSAAWQGPLTVEAGVVIVDHASALGGSTGRTFLNGGTLRLNQSISEPIVFGGGTLAASAARDMNGPLIIPAGETALASGPLRIKGGTSGGGDLSFQLTSETAISTTPLAHAGGLHIFSTQTARPRVTISVDNSYGGVTTVDHANVIVNTPGGLGTTDQGTVLEDSVMRLHAKSLEHVELRSSTLYLLDSSPSVGEELYEGRVTLESSTLSAFQADSFSGERYAIANPIVLAGGDNRIEPPGRVMRILGGVIGEGILLINAPSGLVMESQLAFDGDVELRGGPIRFTQAGGFNGATLVRNGGRLIAEADQHFRRVESGERDTECCNPYAQIEAAPGATLTIDQLRINEGSLTGDIRTAGDVEFFGFASPRTIRNLSSGLNVQLHAGQMFVEDTNDMLGATTGAMIVGRTSDAVIVLQDRLVYEADFHLNNGSGFGYGGALRTDPDSSADTRAVINGDIYLGDRGAYIGDGGRVELKGQIHGGDLNLVDGANVAIVGHEAAYTGETRIRQFAELSLSGGGRLANTTKIELSSEGSRLAVDISPGEGAVVDRIADDIPIEMGGGELGVWPTAFGVHSRERVGQVHLVRGQSNLKGGYTNTGRNDSAVELVIGELTREPGALMTASYYRDRYGSPFLSGNDVYSVGPILENPPALVNGFLPAWLTMHRGRFSTLIGNRVTDVGEYESLLDADETSVVAQNDSGALNGDRTLHGIAAVGYFGGGLDLNGHTLTVGSGGVFNATISNGQIQPGQYADGELILYNAIINASLVDNGGPTSVIYSGDNEIRGTNTYTGTTYVTGEPGDNTLINEASALPAGGDLELSGGSLSLREAVAYEVGSVAIRDNAQLHVQCCGNDATFAAERIDFESGWLGARLTGDMPIEKTTDGIANIAGREYTDFTGDVDVREGLLFVENFPALGGANVTVHAGGRLAFGPDSSTVPGGALELGVTLNGGSLYAGGSQNYDYINLHGNVTVADDSQIYLVNATAKTQSSSDLIIDGSISVAPGKTLEIVGWGNRRFSRYLLATEGFHFGEGSVLAGDGGLRGTVEIADGAILSPGSLSSGVSVGEMSMSRGVFVSDPTPTMIFGAGGAYRWEVNDVNGKAGAIFGEGWDLMRVDGTVAITATPESPFIIELIGLEGAGLSKLSLGEVVSMPILHAATLVGFDPAKFVLDVSGLSPAGRSARAFGTAFGAEFSLRQVGNQIVLDVVGIPEPHSLVLGLAGASLAAVFRRSRWVRDW